MSSDTRERIVAAATKLFSERGFDRATTAEIARSAGIAEGTIYRHFADKKELFLACLVPAVEKALEYGLAGVQEAPDLRSMVRAMLDARIRLMSENRDAFSVFVAEARHHPDLARMMFEQVFVARAGQMHAITQKFLTSGEVRTRPNFTILGLGMTILIWGVLNFQDQIEEVLAKSPLPVSSQNFLDELTDFVLYGIAGRPSGGATP